MSAVLLNLINRKLNAKLNIRYLHTLETSPGAASPSLSNLIPYLMEILIVRNDKLSEKYEEITDLFPESLPI
jgi:hypothetical protein